jgi:prepilin-type N-terminal cleavage/methylation domain-containing protein
MLMRCPRPTRAAARRRDAFTLVEVLITLALSALVLGIAVSVGVRLQRRLLAESTRLAVAEQLASAAQLVPFDLRPASPSAGDVVEARDTSLQLRATTGTGLVCGGSGTSLLVASQLGAGARALPLGATPGDTIWVLVDGDSLEQWRPFRISGARRIAASCPMLDAAGAQLFDVAHLWAADLRDSAVVTPGVFVRLTKPVRYSFYRAGDGHWYLGAHSWNPVALQFNLVQPLAGPYASPLRGGTGFRYFDRSGTALPSGTADGRRIARVEMQLVAEAAAPGLPLPTDTERVVVALRNR